jgi:hypothetical protein
MEVMLKYDDASWHYGGNFPPELPPQAGATHTGMFIAWAVLSGFVGVLHKEHSKDLLTRLERRTISPGQFFIKACDEKFTDEDLNDEGNSFTQEYFKFKTGDYLTDYERVLGRDVPTLYHVPDTWENYDRLKPVLDGRFSEWKSKRNVGTQTVGDNRVENH